MLIRQWLYETGPAILGDRHWAAYSFEFLVFGLKQAWACLFAALLLALILGTKVWYPLDTLARYDFLFLAALSIQGLLLVYRLESPQEAAMILLFHGIATGMELFKTSEAIGSWVYPGSGYFYLYNVPLFAGFMYSAVGSYMARVWKAFRFRFSHYPPLWQTLLVSILIYTNFFTQHFIVDIRYLLFVAIVLMYSKTRIHFTVLHKERWMPLLLGFFLVALFIWLAENISTFAMIWQYPNQRLGWAPVSLQKLGSWYLLMVISFVLVSLLHRRDLYKTLENPRKKPYISESQSFSV
ncbi:MAG: DUF817 domain-containing protein [Gammaproteobacteria bacterium]|nr:DUF817 domain-containing protein [Gammaproteobacteria bacterium]MDH5801460.1 DUF817 domain-containing protein [Gammaproteobacteria bacterium]